MFTVNPSWVRSCVWTPTAGLWRGISSGTSASQQTTLSSEMRLSARRFTRMASGICSDAASIKVSYPKKVDCALVLWKQGLDGIRRFRQPPKKLSHACIQRTTYCYAALSVCLITRIANTSTEALRRVRKYLRICFLRKQSETTLGCQ